MAETKPSGLPIVASKSAPVLQEIAEIDGRGRLHLLRRWANHTDWLPSLIDDELQVLMVFVEPGRLSMRSWEPEGPKIVTRFEEIAKTPDEDGLEALRLIQDRYGRVLVPKDRRPYLGDLALQHLMIPTGRGQKSNVYVAVFPKCIDVFGPAYRTEKLILGHPQLEGLP